MDRANCSSDRRRIVNFAFIANAPLFTNRLANTVASGWQLSAIVRYQSGNFTTITAGSDPNLSGIGGQRPNQSGTNPILSEATPATQRFSVQYLDPTAGVGPSGTITKGAFTTVGLGPGLFGTLGPLNVVNPSMVQVDVKLSRAFQVREHKTVELRWEVFNVPNRVNLAAPNTTLSSGTFGQITSDINGSSSQAGDPRIMQLALKFVF
jgi:hypothetical protein